MAIYADDDTRLPEAISSGLAAFAESNPVEGNPLPIRFLKGRFQATVPGPWTEEQASANGVSLEFAQAHGVTLINWGSAGDVGGISISDYPAEIYRSGGRRHIPEGGIRDTVQPVAAATRESVPLTFGQVGLPNGDSREIELAEYGDRVVWYYMHINYIIDPSEINIDVLFGEPIRRATDPEFAANFRREREEASARAFATRMEGNPERRMADAQARVNGVMEQVANFQQQIITLTQTAQFAQREIDAVLNTAGAGEDHWRAEWNAISHHPRIVEGTLSMTADTLQFDTELLEIFDQENENWLPLGRFRIKVNLDNFGVTINNLNNRRRDRDHPHVANGSPCWGGFVGEVQDHISNNRISALIEFIFGYLQSYNPDDDWGRAIRYWREAPELVEA